MSRAPLHPVASARGSTVIHQLFGYTYVAVIFIVYLQRR